MTKEKFLKDLDKLFERALKEGQLSTALKIKELQGKCLGVFDKTLPSINLEELSDENLEKLIQYLQP